MNTRPVSYLQTDPRWGSLDYSAKGEKTTIRASGCGPTAMAMVLATWADPKITPKTECAWALAHGYKAPHQGTYYGYFAPAAKRFGLTCKMLNGVTLYGKPNSPYHAQAKAAVERGDLVIACMGRGLWTSSGHFVLVWNISGNVVSINDPASTRAVRTQGDWTAASSSRLTGRSGPSPFMTPVWAALAQWPSFSLQSGSAWLAAWRRAFSNNV